MIAVGNNATRKRFAEHARSLGLRLPVLIHPNAYVSPTARLGDGTVVMAGACGHPAKFGELGIINTRASIDHDFREIGDNVHIALGGTMAGGVMTVGDREPHRRRGISILPGLIIGNDSVIGAGSRVVVRDVPPTRPSPGARPSRCRTKGPCP